MNFQNDRHRNADDRGATSNAIDVGGVAAHGVAVGRRVEISTAPSQRCPLVLWLALAGGATGIASAASMN